MTYLVICVQTVTAFLLISTNKFVLIRNNNWNQSSKLHIITNKMKLCYMVINHAAV